MTTIALILLSTVAPPSASSGVACPLELRRHLIEVGQHGTEKLAQLLGFLGRHVIHRVEVPASVPAEAQLLGPISERRVERLLVRHDTESSSEAYVVQLLYGGRTSLVTDDRFNGTAEHHGGTPRCPRRQDRKSVV